ncbi:hypothetical protein AB1Y20_016849 [Prymnesium parvum]|uniref:J domain-containing protein n=1 Tax=Prymnesium parvum TaxID=97485 RepID=A0AB34IDJ8_PRYPA
MKVLRFPVVLALLSQFCSAAASDEKAEDPKGEKSKRDIVAQYEYCREDNCYELLGVSQTSKPPAIKRKYRHLAAEWHPDKNPDPRAKELFQKYANAYEVLSNAEMRSNYDYLLAHPYEFPVFFMRYSKPKYMPKSDIRFVLILTLIIISAIQYLLKHSQYHTALEAMKKDPRYQERLKQLVTEQSSKNAPVKKSGFRGSVGTTKVKKETPKQEELEKRRCAAEEILSEELAAVMPPAPKVSDTIAVDVFKLPLTVASMLGWVVKFNLLRLEYGPAEKAYLTRRAIGLSEAEWEAAEEQEKEDFIAKELWVAKNLSEWEAELTKSSSPGSKSGKDKRLARQKKKGPLGHVGMLE